MEKHVHRIVVMPQSPVVLDLSVPLAAIPDPGTPWTLGRYGEHRGIYTQALFDGSRTVHMGLDLGGPVGTPVHAPLAGTVLHAGYNPADGDYGYVVVTQHRWEGEPIWILLGHLSKATLAQSPVGKSFSPGTILGWFGSIDENGGWPPHVHIQLSRQRPDTHDMPGAVSPSDFDQAQQIWPDPSILGRLY